MQRLLVPHKMHFDTKKSHYRFGFCGERFNDLYYPLGGAAAVLHSTYIRSAGENIMKTVRSNVIFLLRWASMQWTGPSVKH